LLLALLGLHVGAIACAWATRVAIGSRAEGAIQLVFLGAMAAVGFTAWCSYRQVFGLGIPSGVTLIGMVLMAVTDFRRTHEPGHQRAADLGR
jgi:hypothetical protein